MTTVRKAKPGDARAIAALKVVAWCAAYSGLLPSSYLAAMEVDQETSDWHEYLLRIADNDRVWVLFDNPADELIGYARTGHCLDDDLPESYGEVHGLYVHPDHIGEGYGRVLFSHAVRDLAIRRLDPIVVWHFVGNARAETFYENAGFELDGRRRESDYGPAEVRRVGRPQHGCRSL
jgi:GNAT superfamily N-acetyltransferase